MSNNWNFFSSGGTSDEICTVKDANAGELENPEDYALPTSLSYASSNSNLSYTESSTDFDCQDPKLDIAIRQWKTFTDAEFVSNHGNTKVPEWSIFGHSFAPARRVKLLNCPPKTPLREIVSEMITKNLGATCRIRIGGKKFNCIPNLLKIYSLYFAKQDWRICNFKFAVEDVPKKGFELAYKWMRFRKPPAIRDTASMLQVAKYLKIDLLELECWDLLSRESVREKTAIQVYMQAKQMPLLKDLKEVMLTRLRTYFLAFVGHHSFLDLTVDELVELISLDSIGVNSEIEVFLTVLLWLNHMPEERQKHLRRTMSAVRFPYMPMSFLFHLKEGCNNSVKQELYTSDPMLLAFHMDPQTLELLESAMTFIAVRCQHDEQAEFIEVCAEHKLKVQYPRRWIYHVGCPYHIYNLHYPYQHNFTSLEFYDFISSIQLKWIGDGPANYGEDMVLDVA